MTFFPFLQHWISLVLVRYAQLKYAVDVLHTAAGKQQIYFYCISYDFKCQESRIGLGGFGFMPCYYNVIG